MSENDFFNLIRCFSTSDGAKIKCIYVNSMTMQCSGMDPDGSELLVLDLEFVLFSYAVRTIFFMIRGVDPRSFA